MSWLIWLTAPDWLAIYWLAACWLVGCAGWVFVVGVRWLAARGLPGFF